MVGEAVEDIEAQGGLNDLQARIVEHCTAHNIPLLVCMSRGKLGRALGRRVGISVVGIEMLDGCEEIWKQVRADYAVVLEERRVRALPPPAPAPSPAPPPLASTHAHALAATAAPFVPRVRVDAPAPVLMATAAPFVPRRGQE